MKEHLKESILKLRNDGLTYNEIRKELGCSKSVISFHCRKENIHDYNSLVKIPDELIEKIKSLYSQLKSSRKVAKELNISKSTVLKYVDDIDKINLTEDEIKDNNVKSVVHWRIRTKEKLVEYKGGECVECGYKKCIDALEFHHLDPKEKDFTISGKSWSLEKLKKEVDKCILVCSNCHKEIHYKIRNMI
jgi:DNA-binding CsgD family transcriptional regulator